MFAAQIKTTAPTRYKVRPSLAILESKSIAKVQVVLVPGKKGRGKGGGVKGRSGEE